MAVAGSLTWGETTATVYVGQTITVPITSDSSKNEVPGFGPTEVADIVSASSTELQIIGQSEGTLTILAGTSWTEVNPAFDMATTNRFTLTVLPDEPKVAKQSQWEDLASKIKSKADASSVPTVVQTTGTSTTDVMSQNAVTGEIWLDPTNQTHVSIGTKRTYSPNGYGVQIGENAASSSYAVAIGGSDTTTNASVATRYSIAIGYGARGSQESSVAIGRSAIVGDNPRSVAIGYTAYARGPQSSAIGSEAKTGYSATSAVALGTGANASGIYSIALGAGSSASTQGEMNVGMDRNSGYNNSRYRLITGVYDPQSAQDAATKNYVDAGDSSISFGTDNTTYWTHPTTDNSGTVTTVNLPNSSYNRVETSFFVTSATSHSGELYIGVQDVEPGSTTFYRRHGMRDGAFSSAYGQYSVPSTDTFADAFHTANATWSGLVVKQTAIRIGTVTWMLQIDLSAIGNASTEHYDVQCTSNSATTAPGIYVRQSPFADATGHREGKIWITH